MTAKGERDRAPTPGIQAKLVRESLLMAVAIAVTTLAIAAAIQIDLSRRQRVTLEAQIERTLTARGASITRSQAVVFRTFAADNAVLEMHNTVARSIASGDALYGVYVGVEGRVLAYCSPVAPCLPSSEDDEFPVYDEKTVLETLRLPADAGKKATPSVREASLFGQQVLEFAEPVSIDGEPAGVLRYGLTKSTLTETLAAARRAETVLTETALGIFALGLAGIVGLAVYFARRNAERITEPLSDLTKAAERLAAGDRRVAVQVRSGDELQVLGDAFNHMVTDLDQSYRRLETKNRELEAEIEERRRVENERSELQNRLVQSQKMDAFGQLAGGVAHDFNNIIAVVMGNSELLGHYIKEGKPPADLVKLCQDIRNAGARGASLTQQLLTFARRQADNPRIVDVNETLRGFWKLIHRVLEEHVRLDLVLGDLAHHVKIDPGRLEQVLMNLCVNARDAMPEGGTLRIATSEVVIEGSRAVNSGELLPGRYVSIAAKDSGHGMGAPTLQRIFEPFFTTKAAGKGTGLGLATVHSIVQAAGGAIEVDSAEGAGATFTVFLPAVSAITTPEPARAAAPERAGKGGRVLLCEDDDAVRQMTRRVLERAGYEVTDVALPGQALEALRGSRFDLLLSDVIMPEMNGKELAEQARRLTPDLPVIFISGYTGGALSTRGLAETGAKLLHKPFESHELLDLVRSSLERGASPEAR